MGRRIAPAGMTGVIAGVVVVGTGAATLGAATGGSTFALGAAQVGVLAGVLTIVGTVIVRRLWLAGTITNSVDATVDPEAAGIIPVALVTRSVSDWWVAATILRIAERGIIVIHHVSSADIGGGHDRIRFELIGDPTAVEAAALAGDDDAAVARALFGHRLAHGVQAAGAPSAATRARLAKVGRSGAREAARSYVDTVPKRWRRALFALDLLAFIAGLVVLSRANRPEEALVAAAALVMGSVA
ncbi:hypothetical protein [Agromyces bracchium]|uniref:hypothetical protein n=1 Tax=Agromyces bracchium TaxID=88376 RepID=UPI0018ACB230|nr:hypothetical protein [Agromyces bracchium]